MNNFVKLNSYVNPHKMITYVKYRYTRVKCIVLRAETGRKALPLLIARRTLIRLFLRLCVLASHVFHL